MRTIAAKAENEGRGFTDGERSRIEQAHHRGEVRQGRRRQRRQGPAGATRRRQAGLSYYFGFGTGSAGLGSRKSGVWGEAFLKAMPAGPFGAKDLTPSGSLTLPALSTATAPEAEGVPGGSSRSLPFGLNPRGDLEFPLGALDLSLPRPPLLRAP